MSFKYIFHLSDLHIRNGDIIQSRYDEYKFVFDNTIISINNQINKLKLNNNEYLIVITGDIFHNKTNIGNYGLLLYRTFIENLTKIGKVIVIQGNHDINQSVINHPSLVYSSSFHIDNLIILENTTSLILTNINNNIGFSYVSVNDTLDSFKNTGRIQELPEFPKINGNVTYKIGLFHGTFAKVKLYNGDEVKDDIIPYPLEWIKDFDFMLLGDIHKRQTFIYKNTYCGYSGSLIQQNFGEDILEHGYLLWDLNNKKIDEINVYNNIGYINIKENDNEDILIRINGKYETKLEDFITNNLKLFPKHLEIKTFSKINFHNLNTLLKSFNIYFIIISKIDNNPISTILNTNENIMTDIEINTFNNNDYILSYFKKMLTPDKYKLLSSIITDKYKLLFDTSNYPDDLINECIKKNKDILDEITQCDKYNELTKNSSSFIIKYLEWEGLICYQDKNWINFNNLDSKTFLVKGENGHGKSAIYDILLLAIWGKNIKTKSLSGGFINHKKNKGYTNVDIQIDNTVYRISRSFERKKLTDTLNNYDSVLYKFVDDNVLEVYKEDTSCNNEVIKLVGDYNNFLFSSMITQNIYNDILKVDNDVLLKLIDKYSNVEYIYNLNNLFKVASNKYKDFKRTIENKKQVYEKLLSTNKIDDINDDDLLKTNEKLSSLIKEKDDLLIKFNSIPFDIKNPKILLLLDTDYQQLINDLKYRIISDDEYHIIFDKYNELKYLLKDINDDELIKLKNLYTDDLELKLKNTIIINKPCDISLLINEESFLKSYLIDYKETSTDIDLKHLEKLINELIQKRSIYYQQQNDLIHIKPERIDHCFISKDKCIDDILIYYTSIDYLFHFIKTNQKCPLQLSNSKSNIITFDEYNININKLNELIKLKELNNKKLSKLEDDFKLCFKKQQDIHIVNKPLIPITYKKTNTIKRTMNTININNVLQQIEQAEKQLIEYNHLIDKRTVLENELSTFNQELLLLNTNEEYKYNPLCEFCCRRSWVSRINELIILINKYQQDIKTINDKIIQNNYLSILKELNEYKKLKDKYYLLNDWYEYYKYNDLKEKISNQLNAIIIIKEQIINILTTTDNEINKINISNNDFNIKSYQLYDSFINIDKYDKWNDWNIKYNQLLISINDISNEIIKQEYQYNYYLNIKPRIIKYFQLKDLYNQWEYINNIQLIIRAFQFYNYKNLLDTYQKYKDYNNNHLSKLLIKDKIIFNDKIQDIDKQIKTLNDSHIKYTTIYLYNKHNKDTYIRLSNIYDDIDIIIDTLDTIITNFLAFKIELYDKFILNHLTHRTNLIIKSLCHKNTKPFKLDYYLSVSKDKIHINWLISIDSNIEKKLISISNASGFQQFAISLALRLSLFSNKNEILCNQLFIDEGFVNFDKHNLSIVPSFLKSLLSYFNTIIIVSHIDLIQDNIDEIATIIYNPFTSVSHMNYQEQIKTISKKIKKK